MGQCQTWWPPCCPLLNAAVWLTPTTRVPCSNAANIGERKSWTQSEFCTWQNSVTGQEPPKVYSVPVQETAKHLVWSVSIERHRCSNVNTRNPLKFARVLETNEPISAASGRKFITIFWGMWGRYCCLTSFFPFVDTCLSCWDISRVSCAMVPRWRIFGNFFLCPVF